MFWVLWRSCIVWSTISLVQLVIFISYFHNIATVRETSTQIPEEVVIRWWITLHTNSPPKSIRWEKVHFSEPNSNPNSIHSLLSRCLSLAPVKHQCGQTQTTFSVSLIAFSTWTDKSPLKALSPTMTSYPPLPRLPRQFHSSSRTLTLVPGPLLAALWSNLQ